MPFIEVQNTRLHYQIDGKEDAPVLVLSNSLGTDMGMWDAQLSSLTAHFRVVRYDTRGHGQSDVSLPGDNEGYTIDQLGQDIVSLLDKLDIQRAHFCGLSMGGMTGIWLGIHAPERLNKLVLCNTAAKIGTPELWNARIDTVLHKGMSAITNAVIERWFTPRFQEHFPQKIAPITQMLLSSPIAGYNAACAAVRDMDQRADLNKITVPTLVIAGTHDTATPAADGRYAADHIPNARYVELDAAHLSNIEAEEPFTAELLNFLLN